MDADLAAAVEASPAWRANGDLLPFILGVGPAVSQTLLTELPVLGTLSREEVTALAGVDPMKRERGAVGRVPLPRRGWGGGCGWRCTWRP